GDLARHCHWRENVRSVGCDAVWLKRAQRQQDRIDFRRNPFAKFDPVDALHVARARRALLGGIHQGRLTAARLSCFFKLVASWMHPLHPSIHHHPIHWPIESHDLLEEICRATARDTYEIGSKSWPSPAERVFLMQRQRSIHRDHFKNLIERHSGLAALKRAL